MRSNLFPKHDLEWLTLWSLTSAELLAMAVLFSALARSLGNPTFEASPTGFNALFTT